MRGDDARDEPKERSSILGEVDGSVADSEPSSNGEREGDGESVDERDDCGSVQGFRSGASGV